MNFCIGQVVRVFPNTRLLRRYRGWSGVVDMVEFEDDATGGCWIYRVKLHDEPGQGYPYYAHELQAAA